MTSSFIDPEKAWIFRIVHRDNIEWILQHGLHARNGAKFDPNYRSIGKKDLIDKRAKRPVPIPPGGTLSDYVPFYFTPCSMMLYNICTGYGGVEQLPREEILIFVASLRQIAEAGLPFVFTNQHAYQVPAEYYSDLNQLDRVDWPLLRRRDFSRDDEDPRKTDRYQAEALIWKHVPLDALSGICCYDEETRSRIDNEAARRNVTIRTALRPIWYFVC